MESESVFFGSLSLVHSPLFLIKCVSLYMTFETTRSEMAVGSNLLESGEMMLARMVEERDNDKLELFLQEMDNLDNFLDEAESLLKSGQDDNEVSMDDEDDDLADLLQIGDGDLIPMKDIPMHCNGDDGNDISAAGQERIFSREGIEAIEK